MILNRYQKIYIPKSVYNEVNFKNNFKSLDFIEIVEVKPNELLKSLKLLLDIGESEAIYLAKIKQMPLIIDEKKGRKIALNLNLKIIGLLGIIYLNVKKEFITKQEAKQLISQAISNGYRISQTLISSMFDRLS